MAEEQRGTNNIYSGATPFNALEFIIGAATDKMATAIPVKVVAVYPGGKGPTGYIDALPLVAFQAGNGESIQPVTLFHLPYSRIQGGVAALIIDPIVGDIGLAVFAHSDSSNVGVGTTEPQAAGSKRHHSMSDGFYIGGFLNQTPTCYLELTQSTAELRAVGGIHLIGDVTVDGKITSTGDMVSGSISAQHHVHGGVQSGGSATSTPQ